MPLDFDSITCKVSVDLIIKNKIKKRPERKRRKRLRRRMISMKMITVSVIRVLQSIKRMIKDLNPKYKLKLRANIGWTLTSVFRLCFFFGRISGCVVSGY